MTEAEQISFCNSGSCTKLSVISSSTGKKSSASCWGIAASIDKRTRTARQIIGGALPPPIKYWGQPKHLQPPPPPPPFRRLCGDVPDLSLQPFQPRNIKFPYRKTALVKCSFQVTRFNRFSWLIKIMLISEGQNCKIFLGEGGHTPRLP